MSMRQQTFSHGIVFLEKKIIYKRYFLAFPTLHVDLKWCNLIVFHKQLQQSTKLATKLVVQLDEIKLLVPNESNRDKIILLQVQRSNGWIANLCQDRTLKNAFSVKIMYSEKKIFRNLLSFKVCDMWWRNYFVFMAS